MRSIQRNLHKAAAILALIIGGMAVFAGGKVLLGNDPGYFVIDWLPIYNAGMGLVSVLFTTVLLWTGHKYAVPAAVATFAMHSLVMLILQTMYREAVAAESQQAMTIRLIVWGLILILMWVQSRQRKATQKPATT